MRRLQVQSLDFTCFMEFKIHGSLYLIGGRPGGLSICKVNGLWTVVIQLAIVNDPQKLQKIYGPQAKSKPMSMFFGLQCCLPILTVSVF